MEENMSENMSENISENMSGKNMSEIMSGEKICQLCRLCSQVRLNWGVGEAGDLFCIVCTSTQFPQFDRFTPNNWKSIPANWFWDPHQFASYVNVILPLNQSEEVQCVCNFWVKSDKVIFAR